jgi:cell division septal protein FtsQ
MNRRLSKPVPLKKQKKYRRNKKTIIFFILFCILVILVFWIIRHPSLQIKEFEISELKYTDRSNFQNIVENHISGNYLFFLPKSSYFFISEKEILDSLTKSIKSVKNIEMKVEDFNKIIFKVEEFIPVAIWCVEQEKLDKDECFLMNENGVVYAEEPIDHILPLPRFFGVLNSDNPIGQMYLNENTFRNLLSLVEKLKSINIHVPKISTSDSITFSLYSLEGPRLVFNINDDIGAIFSNLDTVIKAESLDGAQWKNIDYIDLRFGNKVYYTIK